MQIGGHLGQLASDQSRAGLVAHPVWIRPVQSAAIGRHRAAGEDGNANVAFVPLAMPIMFGPGAIAILISMALTIKQSPGEMLHFLAASAAIVACMAVIYLSLVYAEPILRKIGRQGIDAATRIVGFFVAAMGMGLIFNGAVEFLAPASLRDKRTAEGTGAGASPLRSACRPSPDRRG